MALITAEQVADRLRIRHTKTLAEIEDNIHAALEELSRAGVDTSCDSALLNKAIELYVKAQLDYQGKGEQYRSHFNDTRDAMSVSSAYREA